VESEQREPRASAGPSFRSVFISDLHLGSRRARVGRLLHFLRGLRCDVLYLVGDIVDSWGPGGTRAWPPAHREVLQEFQNLVAAGTRVHYLRGNHDGAFGDDWLRELSEITARRELEYETRTVGASSSCTVISST
jgi:UDP-2,3-diacylglucosamine pyrophosphatase LpxH